MFLYIKNYLKLSKFGIVVLVLLTSALGYLLSMPVNFSYSVLAFFILGVYLVSSGSFILNQAQEAHLDVQMDRTKNRPIPQGFYSVNQAYSAAFFAAALGLGVLFYTSVLVMVLSLFTVLLYNFFYTLKWKKKYPYSAVFLGAVPGAMPVVMGYCAGAESFLSLECLYLFLIMFLWQMPHFWSLAFRYKQDYAKAQIPVLPVYAGVEKTFFQIGLYVFAYLGVALLAPLFLKTGWIYIVTALPFCLKILAEFYYFYTRKHWLPFFSWLNISLLVFLFVPLLDWWFADKIFNI